MTQDPTGQPGPADQPPAAPSYGTPPPAAPAYGTAPSTPPSPPPPPAPPAPPSTPAYGTPSAGSPPPPAGQPPYSQPGYQQYPPQSGYAAPGAQPLSPAEERQWSMFAHLGGIIGILPSLIIYLIFKDRGPFVKAQSTEALNFQITILIGYIIGVVLSYSFLPIPVQLLVWIVSIVFSVMAGMAANRGENYRYPFALRLIQ